MSLGEELISTMVKSKGYIKELKRSLNERYTFFSSEINYAKFILQISPREEYSFFIEDWVVQLSEILESVKRDIEKITVFIDQEKFDDGFNKLYDDITGAYVALPEFYHRIEDYVFQRQHAGLKHFSPYIWASHSFLSGVHPSYSTSVRAIEAVNLDCYHRLSSIYDGEISSGVLPIVLSSGKEFAYASPIMSKYTGSGGRSGLDDLLKSNDREYYKTMINRNFHLHSFFVPRWSIYLLRHITALYHENSHMVFRIIEFMNLDRSANDDENRLKEVYGPFFFALYNKYLSLLNSLIKNVPPPHDISVIQRCTDYIGETLADAGSILLGGPSTLHSFASRYQDDTTVINFSTHPPHRCRTWLMMKILQKYGFNTTAEICRQTYTITPPNYQEGDGFIRVFVNWITNDESIENITEFINLLGNKCSDTLYQYKEKEKFCENIWGNIIMSLSNGEIPPYSNESDNIVSPMNLLNALWIYLHDSDKKDMEDYESSGKPSELAWRLSLSRWLDQNIVKIKGESI